MYTYNNVCSNAEEKGKKRIYEKREEVEAFSLKMKENRVLNDAVV